MAFNKTNPKGGFTETFKDICKSNLTVGSSSTMCFYGILMGYMMEEGFGFKNTSSNNWEVRFKSRVSSAALFVGVLLIQGFRQNFHWGGATVFT